MSLIDKAAGNATEGDRNLEVVRPILMEDVEVVEISYNLVGFRAQPVLTSMIPWYLLLPRFEFP